MNSELRKRMEVLRSRLLKHGQSHLLDFAAQLSEKELIRLLDSLENIDYVLMEKLFLGDMSKEERVIDMKRIEAIPYTSFGKISPKSQASWLDSAEEILRAGKAAAFLVAGGQGSRLGFDGPKGVCKIGLPSEKSIFQLQAEKLLRIGSRYDIDIPWYIMTSPINHDETVEFFENHDYFGYKADSLLFFPQGVLPAVDEKGKILLETPGKVALVPDGNGGCYKALAKSGALEDMEGRGIEYVYQYSVDNVLARVCDPQFLGFFAESGTASCSKIVRKAYPEERVGIFVLEDSKPGVIEYSELDPHFRYLEKDGRLVYDSSNIAIHYFRTDALRKLVDCNLPYHRAHKKIPFIAANGDYVQPREPNAWKFEQFMFDAFPALGTMSAIETRRAEEFAPVKNADGVDSPDSARHLMMTLHTEWLRQNDNPTEPGVLYEISPLLSYWGEDLDNQSLSKHLGTLIYKQ